MAARTVAIGEIFSISDPECEGKNYSRPNEWRLLLREPGCL